MKKIVVTGGSGKAGRATIRELLEPAAAGPAEQCVAPAAPSAATTSVSTPAGPDPPWVLCIEIKSGADSWARFNASKASSAVSG